MCNFFKNFMKKFDEIMQKYSDGMDEMVYKLKDFSFTTSSPAPPLTSATTTIAPLLPPFLSPPPCMITAPFDRELQNKRCTSEIAIPHSMVITKPEEMHQDIASLFQKSKVLEEMPVSVVHTDYERTLVVADFRITYLMTLSVLHQLFGSPGMVKELEVNRNGLIIVRFKCGSVAVNLSFGSLRSLEEFQLHSSFRLEKQVELRTHPWREHPRKPLPPPEPPPRGPQQSRNLESAKMILGLVGMDSNTPKGERRQMLMEQLKNNLSTPTVFTRKYGNSVVHLNARECSKLILDVLKGGSTIEKKGAPRFKVVLTEALAKCRNLEEIDLWDNMFGVEVSFQLSKDLCQHEYLTEIYSSYSNMEDVGAIARANALKELAPSLGVSQMAGIDIVAEAALCLVACIFTKKSIVKLNLSKDDSKDNGAIMISKALGEGLGNSKDGFHTSQFGFCTLGMCVTFFSEFVNAEKTNHLQLSSRFSKLTVSEIEMTITGNLSRCIGHRPITDVSRSVVVNVALQDLESNSFWRKGDCMKEYLDSCEGFEFEIRNEVVLPPLEAALVHMVVDQSAYFRMELPPNELILAAAGFCDATLSLSSLRSCKLDHNITLLQGTEPLKERREQALFCPPLSRQCGLVLMLARLDILMIGFYSAYLVAEKDIYCITGESKKSGENLAFLERLKKEEEAYDVLYMVDARAEYAVSKLKELILRRQSELEDMFEGVHMDIDSEQVQQILITVTEFAGADFSEFLLRMNDQITKAKEQAQSRKAILDKLDKWRHASKEDSWLDEYNKCFSK